MVGFDLIRRLASKTGTQSTEARPRKGWRLRLAGRPPKALLVSLAAVVVIGPALFLLSLNNQTRRPQSSYAAISLSIEDPDGRGLLHFYTALMRTTAPSSGAGRRRVARIVHYGDSHIAADILTGVLRNHFQSDFGDAGPGFVIPGNPWKGYFKSGIESGRTSGWKVEGLKESELPEDPHLGLAGVSLTAIRPNERLWLRSEGSIFDLYLLKQPGGGSVEIMLDGRNYRRLSLRSSDYRSEYLTVDPVGVGPHTIEFRTVAPGPVTVFGVNIETGKRGVQYDALGINGARATRPLLWDWKIISNNLRRLNPDLIVVSYGTNEVGDADFDVSEYQRKFAELLRRFRSAVPNASILVISPPDRERKTGNGWQTFSQMAGLVRVQRASALSSGAAFLNMYDGLGGAGSISVWAASEEPLAQPDHVHLTRTGYRFVADALYEEIRRDYLESVWRAFRSLASRPVRAANPLGPHASRVLPRICSARCAGRLRRSERSRGVQSSLFSVLFLPCGSAACSAGRLRLLDGASNKPLAAAPPNRSYISAPLECD